MGYLFFAWMASFLYAFEVIVSKMISKYSLSNPWLLNFVWSLMVLLLTIPIALKGGVTVPSHWFNLLMAGFFSALSGILYIFALYRLDVSVLSPLFNLRSAFSVILGIFLLGETLKTGQVFLIGLTFFAGVLVTLDEHWSVKSFLKPAVLIALADMLCLAFFGVYTKKSIAENGFWPAIFFIPLIGQLMFLFTLPKFTADLKTINIKNLASVFVVALAGTLGTLAANKAFAENVSISTVILSLPMSMIMVFLLSRIKPELLEKHTNKVYLTRFIAVGIMIVAAVKLSVNRGV